MRQPAFSLGLARAAALPWALAAAGFAVPASANSAIEMPAPRAAAAANAPLSAHFDSSRRTLFIGAAPPAEPSADDSQSHVTVGLDQDLVGRQMRLVWTAQPNAASGNGMLPTGMPVSARAMTSAFGMRSHPLLGGYRAHNGVDLAAPTGSPIRATSDGTVGSANWNGGYGLFVSLEHGGGVETRYGHMSRLNVVAGQQVKKGDVIGYVGSTGRSTGPHLHYEVRRNGRAVNPSKLMGR